MTSQRTSQPKDSPSRTQSKKFSETKSEAPARNTASISPLKRRYQRAKTQISEAGAALPTRLSINKKRTPLDYPISRMGSFRLLHRLGRNSSDRVYRSPYALLCQPPAKLWPVLLCLPERASLDRAERPTR